MGHLFGGYLTIADCHLTLMLGSSQSTCMDGDFNVAMQLILDLRDNAKMVLYMLTKSPVKLNCSPYN